MSKKLIRRSKTYGIVGIFMSFLLFILGLIWLFQNFLFFSLFVILLSIFLSVVCIMGLRDVNPRIIMDDHGIYARDLGTEKILWSDIKSAKLSKIPRSGAFISLELDDETKYPSLGYHQIGRKINNAFGLSRLTITVTGLDTSANQIYNEIQLQIAQNNSPITETS